MAGIPQFPDLISQFLINKKGFDVDFGEHCQRMACYIGDSDADVRRIDVPLTPSDWGIWVLSHVDLRCTARV